MRGRAVGALACAALCASSACSLFTDLGGFDDEGTTTFIVLDAASAEAGGGEDDATTTGFEASDGSAGDAAPSSPTDAGPCGATFCDDFGGLPFAAKWTGKVENGGTVVASSNELLASMTGNASDTLRQAFLYKRFDAPLTMSCTFRIYPVDLSAATEVSSFFATVPGYKSFSLWLALRSGHTELGIAAEKEEGGTIYDTRGVPLVGAGKWTTITMATDFATLSLSEDGTVVKDEAFFPKVAPTRVDAQVGITFQYSTAPSSVRVDDVACTVTP